MLKAYEIVRNKINKPNLFVSSIGKYTDRIKMLARNIEITGICITSFGTPKEPSYTCNP